ncbi:MAG: class I adenylate-forming enzyme family protein [Polyangiales bacterium]
MSRVSLSAAPGGAGDLAILDASSGAEVTLGELRSRAARVGALLAARGVRAGDRVTLRASNRVETAAALLSMLDRGVVAAPLHPRLSDREAEALRRDAEAAAHLDDGDLDEVVHPTNDLPMGSNDLAAMLYTSGSSGRPKGALLGHRALVASARASAENLGWTPTDRWLLALPLCHVGGLSVLTRCLLAGRPVVTLPRFDPDAVLDAVVRHRTTLVSVVPTMLHALLERDRGNALAGLRAVLVGGAALPLALREEAVARGVACVATYGLTEACSQVATQRPERPPRARDTVGAPLRGLRLRVADDEGAPARVGEVGRILIRGEAMMTGYRGAEPLGDAWFDTGDHGALGEDGELRVRGRRTDLIVTGGENVYPAEVEQCVAGHPDVEQALVFGVDDPVWGQRVAVLVVPRAGLDAEALRGWLRARLAGFKRPRLYAEVPAIPTLPSGKVDRRGALAAHRGALRAW